MVANTEKPVRASGYGEQRIEALGQKPHLDLQCNDGSVVRIPHPLRLGDDALARVEALQRGDGLDREPVLDDAGKPVRGPSGRPETRIVEPPQVDGRPAAPYVVRAMRAVLGDADYDKLREHGMTAAELYAMWDELSESAPASESPDPKGTPS